MHFIVLTINYFFKLDARIRGTYTLKMTFLDYTLQIVKNNELIIF